MRLLAISCEGLTSLALWFDGRRCRVKCSETADSVAFGKRSPATQALGNVSMEWAELFVWEVTNALEVLVRNPSTGLRPRCLSRFVDSAMNGRQMRKCAAALLPCRPRA